MKVRHELQAVSDAVDQICLMNGDHARLLAVSGFLEVIITI
jgi:hypothetical protein